VDDEPVELSGFHAVKHALRFHAPDLRAWTDDRRRVVGLCERLAPDVAPALEAVLTDVGEGGLADLTDHPHHTRLLGTAARRRYGPRDLAGESGRPSIHLDRPVDPGNVGAVIRVAAAVGAAGVAATGFDQLWAPACVRGSAGLHYAVPVLDADLAASAPGRPIVAFDPDGEVFRPERIETGSALVFGSERDGISPDVLERADRVVRLPMRPGVSSLNLATSVAAATYGMALEG
jgi:tRNA G18 (ribose-2'-O)-methylase SpoU